MLTHAEILTNAGGAAGIRRLFREKFDANLPKTTVQSWIDRDNIPARYWSALEQVGVTTARQLAMCMTGPGSGLASGG